MIKVFGRVAAVVAVLGVLAAPASAQLHDNAVYPAMPGVGVTIAGDFALGMNEDTEVTPGEKPMFAGGRITLGLPMFSVWAGAGMAPIGVDAVDSKLGFGGGAGYHVLQGPLLPVTVSVQAGVGYWSSSQFGDESILNVPFGVLLVANVPSPIDVKPWIMPRGQLVRVSFEGASESEFGFGASGGLMVTAPMGIGAHVTLDWLSIKSGDSPRFNPLTVSGGLHYKVAVPSLGM